MLKRSRDYKRQPLYWDLTSLIGSSFNKFLSQVAWQIYETVRKIFSLTKKRKNGVKLFWVVSDNGIFYAQDMPLKMLPKIYFYILIWVSKAKTRPLKGARYTTILLTFFIWTILNNLIFCPCFKYILGLLLYKLKITGLKLQKSCIGSSRESSGDWIFQIQK